MFVASRYAFLDLDPDQAREPVGSLSEIGSFGTVHAIG